MIQVTDKDRIFVVVAVPAALAALYFFFVHAPRAKALDQIRSRYEMLGDAEDLELDRPALERRRAEMAAKRAEVETVEAKRIADGGGETASSPGDDSARLSRMVDLFDGAEGVKLTAAERIEVTANGEPRARALVRETLGIATPALWRFTVTADYPSLLRVLGAAGERGLPAIVDGVSFDGAAGGRAGRGGARTWRIDVWL
jgi:hypothetical protein